jgi:hypothetical protein
VKSGFDLCGHFVILNIHRHPELVSGSLEVRTMPDEVLKRVQDDDERKCWLAIGAFGKLAR